MKSFFPLILMLFIVSCSRKSDVELYNEGKSAEAEKNFTKATELFEEAVNRYPAQAYAESSLARLAVIYNNDVKDPRKALDAYRRFYTLFPSSKQAPTMLFLSGFLLNNELRMIDSAKLVYETFLQKYPQHELAASARFELENLGKEPGQSLNSNLSASGESEPSKQQKPPKK